MLSCNDLPPALSFSKMARGSFHAQCGYCLFRAWSRKSLPKKKKQRKKKLIGVSQHSKLQALPLYDTVLPSTTAVFSYAIRSRKLSANEQFFVGAQTVVILFQTTQIKQGVSFIAANKVYTNTNKTTIVWIETELSFLPGVDASRVYVRAWALLRLLLQR